MVSARLAVIVIEEMMRSILPVCSAGIRPAKAVLRMTSSLCRDFASARASSTSMPVGWFCSSVMSNGGEASSMPTTS